jgi:hypothetical protein
MASLGIPIKGSASQTSPSRRLFTLTAASRCPGEFYSSLRPSRNVSDSRGPHCCGRRPGTSVGQTLTGSSSSWDLPSQTSHQYTRRGTRPRLSSTTWSAVARIATSSDVWFPSPTKACEISNGGLSSLLTPLWAV